MRMHPRKFGAYSISARAGSAFTNKMSRRNKNSGSDNSGCEWIAVGIVLIIFTIVMASCQD